MVVGRTSPYPLTSQKIESNSAYQLLMDPGNRNVKVSNLVRHHRLYSNGRHASGRRTGSNEPHYSKNGQPVAFGHDGTIKLIHEKPLTPLLDDPNQNQKSTTTNNNLVSSSAYDSRGFTNFSNPDENLLSHFINGQTTFTDFRGVD